MVPRNSTHDIIRDSRPLAKPRQMELLHLSLPAHIVHQKVGVPFAPNESHNCLLFDGSWRSV
jgi:hypothetical protein